MELQRFQLVGANWELMVEARGICIYRRLDEVAAVWLEGLGLLLNRAKLSRGMLGCGLRSWVIVGLVELGEARQEQCLQLT